MTRDWELVVTIKAWPFLVAPTEEAAPRLIVAPDWAVANRELLAAVRQSPQHVPATVAGTAVCRLARTGVADFCLAYRVLKVRKRDYGVGGDEPAYDQAHRQIEAIEGLAVRCGEEEAAALRVGSADLDTVHAAVIKPYQEYWQHPNAFHVQAARSFALTGQGTLISLRALDPWLSLDYERSLGASHGTSPVPLPSERKAASGDPVSAKSVSAKSAPRDGAGDRRGARIITIAVSAAVVAAGIGVAISRSLGNSPPSVQQPRDFTGRATSDTTIRMTWAAPATGPEPDHYEINVNGHLMTVSGSATAYVLKRLSPSTNYRVWIAAFGNGTESRPTETITVTTPQLLPDLADLRPQFLVGLGRH